MDDEHNAVTHSSLGSTVTAQTVRCIRVAVMIGLLLAVTACTTADPAPDPGGSCRGFAGMQVPNCDFSTPPSY